MNPEVWCLSAFGRSILIITFIASVILSIVLCVPFNSLFIFLFLLFIPFFLRECISAPSSPTSCEIFDFVKSCEAELRGTTEYEVFVKSCEPKVRETDGLPSVKSCKT